LAVLKDDVSIVVVRKNKDVDIFNIIIIIIIIK